MGVEEFRDVVLRSDLNRPVDDAPRLIAMLSHSNLLVTARDSPGHLIGVARSLTDFAYCCYLSDLCVDDAWQGRGIGRALVAETRNEIANQVGIALRDRLAPAASIFIEGSDLVGIDLVFDGAGNHGRGSDRSRNDGPFSKRNASLPAEVTVLTASGSGAALPPRRRGQWARRVRGRVLDRAAGQRRRGA